MNKQISVLSEFQESVDLTHHLPKMRKDMSLITPFDPWKGNLCTCPTKYSLSAYTGCTHGCLYCYASSYIRRFSQPREKKDFLKRLEKEIKKVPKGSLIAMANSSDPYLSLEQELKLTRASLKIMKEYDLSLNIVTKSSLLLRDLDILKSFKKIVVSISLTTLNKELARKLEPYSPSPQERLRTVKELSSYLPVAVRFDPLIYPLNTEEIEGTIREIKISGARQVITSTYQMKPDNFKRMVAAFPGYKELWQKLYLKQGEKIGGYTYLPKTLRKDLINKVREIALSEGLEFSSCREGFGNLNTTNCDGSAL